MISIMHLAMHLAKIEIYLGEESGRISDVAVQIADQIRELSAQIGVDESDILKAVEEELSPEEITPGSLRHDIERYSS